MLHLLWGVLTRQSVGNGGSCHIFYTQELQSAEMSAQVEVIVEKVIDASSKQVRSGESKEFLLKET